MDLKYILCEPISKFVVKASEQQRKYESSAFEWHQQPIMDSPTSIYSSLSSSSSTSSSNDELMLATPRSHSFSSLPINKTMVEKQRRRTTSDISHSKQHLFIHHKTQNIKTPHNNIQTRTPWTPFEDQLLQKGYDQGLSWAMISSTYLPHRSRGCCWGRFKTLQNKNMIDSNQTYLRHFKRPWKAIDFNHKQH